MLLFCTFGRCGQLCKRKSSIMFISYINGIYLQTANLFSEPSIAAHIILVCLITCIYGLWLLRIHISWLSWKLKNALVPLILTPIYDLERELRRSLNMLTLIIPNPHANTISWKKYSVNLWHEKLPYFNALEIYFPPLNLTHFLQLPYITKCYHDSYVLKLEKADVYRLPYLASSGPGFGL